MRSRQRTSSTFVAVFFVIAGLSLYGCATAHTSATTVASGTPTQVADAWFQAINDGNASAARALFAPKDVGRLDWMSHPPSQWSTFSDVHCRETAVTDQSASDLCTFVESASSTEGSPDSFWSISFTLRPPTRWLITSYGQG